MRRFYVSIISICFLAATICAQSSFDFTCGGKTAKSDKDFAQWINNETLYLATNDEAMQFSKLRKIADKQGFITHFWQKRDTKPATSENEFQIEFCHRFAESEQFESGIPGWKTDRGLVYILFGNPDRIKRGRGDKFELKDTVFEEWFYSSIDSANRNVTFTFVDPTQSNEFLLDRSVQNEIFDFIGSGRTAYLNCTEIVPNAKQVTVQLTPFGFMSLPKGFWAHMSKDYMDAWSGLIESLDWRLRIRYSGGLIESPLTGLEKQIKWRRIKKTPTGAFEYVLVDNGKSQRIVAIFGGFFAELDDVSQIERFLEIVTLYQRGRCEKCFNAANTKSMRKIFERLNK